MLLRDLEQNIVKVVNESGMSIDRSLFCNEKFNGGNWTKI